jgi:hypothetical protein
MAKKKHQYGVSGYIKDRKRTLRELDAADPNTKKEEDDMNPVDRVQEEMNRANDTAKGITERIRNIFNK